MSDDFTTARAQRRQAVADGSATDAVDRRSPRSNPGGSGVDTTSRNRQQRLARGVADDIDIDRDGVGTVDRLDGMDVFLRSSGEQAFGDNIRREFAGEADFVERGDVNPGIDPQAISAAPEVAPDRRGVVGLRARRETAADAEFIERADLEADVGAFGVGEIAVREDRRSAVGERARQGLAGEDPFAEPDDFAADVTAGGIESVGLTDSGARRRAGRQFESETPLLAVDPGTDVTAVDDGFGLTDSAQRRVAARQFESDFELFGTGELDPETDIRASGDGFGLGEDPTRQVAAAELDAQVDELTVRPEDVELRETDDGGFEAIFEGEVR